MHHFIFRRNDEGKAVMSYKYKRYNDAVYPRNYDKGMPFESEEYGTGLILDCKPIKDQITKEKFWIYTVQFKKEDGSTFVTDITYPAHEHILVFPRVNKPLPKDFPIAPFKGSFEETLLEAKTLIDQVLKKLRLSDSHPHEVNNWENFWLDQPHNVDAISDFVGFQIPPHQHHQRTVTKHSLPTRARLDDGCRDVQQVLHEGFSRAEKDRRIAMMNAIIPGLDPVKQGDIVVLDIDVPENAPWYILKFLIGEITNHVSGKNTTKESTMLEIQILCPAGAADATVEKALQKKFLSWRGDDNKLYKLSLERKHINPLNTRF